MNTQVKWMMACAMVLLGHMPMVSAGNRYEEGGSGNISEKLQLASPVSSSGIKTTEKKAVTRFSAGASHLRQQVQIQTQGHHAP